MYGGPHVDGSFVLPVEPFNPIGRIYAPLHLGWEVHVREVCTVAFGLVLSQGRVLAFPFLDKDNELPYPSKDFISLCSNGNTSLSC